jgi:hypothetical protein
MTYALTAVATFTAINIYQTQKAADAQKAAAKKQQTLAEINSARERTSAVRQARIARAQAANAASQSGVASSSGALGGQSAQLSNLAGNVAFQETQTAYGRAIGSDMNRANQYATNAAIAGQLASFSANFIPAPTPTSPTPTPPKPQ